MAGHRYGPGHGSSAAALAQRHRSRSAGDLGPHRATGRQGGGPVMQMQGIPQCVDYVRILPEIILTVFGMIIMVLDPLLDDRSSQKTLGIVGLLGALAAIAATLYQAQYPGLAFWNMVRVDSFSIFFHFLITT